MKQYDSGSDTAKKPTDDSLITEKLTQRSQFCPTSFSWVDYLAQQNAYQPKYPADVPEAPVGVKSSFVDRAAHYMETVWNLTLP